MKKIGSLILLLLGAMGTLQAQQEQDVELSGKELFGDLKARHIGPALVGGRITDLEPKPDDARIIYIGTAGGGVWKSYNGGATAKPIFDDYPQSIGCVKVDPSDPETLWVGTGETWTRNSVSVGKGLYRSSDGGSNWELMGFENSERIAGIAINPENSDEVYVGVLGALWGDNEERGVYKTTDGGKTWSRIFYGDASTGVSDLAIDPRDPRVMYASMWQFRRTGWSFNSGGEKSALYKTTDGGQSWHRIHEGFPEGKLGRIAFALAPSDPDILYAAIEAGADKDKGLYRSDDAGKSWHQLNNDFELVVRPFYFSRLVVDPRNPDVVVKAGLQGSVSRDGGKTFRNLGPMHSDIHDVIFDIKDSDRMYAATDGGAYRSWDGGTTFEIIENMPVAQFYHVSVDTQEPYNVYGGLQDNGSWYGPSSSPGGIEARDWQRVGQGDGFRVYPHPAKAVIYSEMQGAEPVWRYDVKRNKVTTIQPLREKGDPPLRFNWNAAMALSPHHPDRIYIGSQYLHVSDDMGDSWTKLSPDLTTNDPAKQKSETSGGLSRDNSGAENHTTIFTIAESPLNENVIWVGTDDGNLQLTRDGGKHWENLAKHVPGLPANTWVYHIEASNFNPATAYAVFDGHTRNDGKTYVYKTTDYGKSWQSIATPEIEGFARNIQEDYVNPDLLFLGTEFGLYITINGGKSWQQFSNNMPAAAVHYIELQPRTNDLVLATHGRGIIIIDDISPLREINQEVLKKDVHFFNMPVAIINEESNFGGGSGETSFIGANPSPSARIGYYLKKRHTFGKMDLEIRDQDGNTLVQLPAGKSKGVNIVYWNYTIKQPKVATGAALTFGGFTSPRVEAGTYKVVLTKGKDVYETELKVENDPKSLITPAERKEHHRITMQLYDMSQQLAYMVYELDEILNTARQIATEEGDAKAAKLAAPVVKELEELKKKLVVTTGDNYVGRAENELREDIADLYSKLAVGFDAPTPAEMENLRVLEDELETARKDFEKLENGSVSKLQSHLQKSGKPAIAVMNYEEFLEKS